MTTEKLFVILIAGIPLILVLANRLRIDVAALMMAVLLGTAQYFGLNVLGETTSDASDAFAGFSQPVIVTIIGLFALTRALEKVGLMRWLAQRMLKFGGHSEQRLILMFTLASMMLSLFMNNIAVGALLLPSAVDVARRSQVRPSKLLLPIAFGSALGGMATYFTTANIIVSDLLTTASPPQEPLNMLDFVSTGGLIAVLGLFYMAFFAPRLLPNHLPLAEQLILRRGGRELEDAYQIDDRLWEVNVEPHSALIGGTLEQSQIGRELGLSVVAIWHNRQQILTPQPNQILYSGDTLMIIGREDRVVQLVEKGLKVQRDERSGHFSRLAASLIEVMPAPHSLVQGKSLKELEFRNRFGYTAVALWREGRSYRTDVGEFKLKFGDSFLMSGSHERLKSLQRTPDFIVLEPDMSDTPLDWPKISLALGITAFSVGASILGFPTYLAMLSGAILMLLAGLLTMEEAYQSVDWRTIFLISGMYSVSLGMVKTGLAGLMGDGLIHAVEGYGSLGIALGCFVLVMLITQLIGSQIAALIMAPITISVALNLGINPQAIGLVTAIACSASFLTPLSHPVNMLMLGPGNYKFTDYTRLGLGLLLVSIIALIISLKLFWGM